MAAEPWRRPPNAPATTRSAAVAMSFDEVLARAVRIGRAPAADTLEAPAAPLPAANEAEEVADIPPAPRPPKSRPRPATQAPVENPLVAEAVAAPIVDDIAEATEAAQAQAI